MSDGRVYGNDQIEVGDDRRRFSEVTEHGREVDNAAGRERREGIRRRRHL
jgi:hypothetical protein